MAPIPSLLRRWRWPHWLLATLATLYLLYVALAYLYLPGKLQQLVRQDASQQIGRDMSVGEIAFNPFRLALTVQDFALADRPGQPLLGWQRLHVDLDAWGSLTGWQLRLGEVALDGLRLNVERRKDDFNFSSILQRLDSGTPPEPEDDGTRFAIRIDRIQLTGGALQFDDNSGKKPATSRLEKLDLALKDLYLATGDQTLNPFRLSAQMPGGGELALQGEYRIDPLQVHSQISLKALNLPTFADFIENYLPLHLEKGQLDIQLQADISQQDRVQVQLHDGSLQLRDLALDDGQAEPPLLRNRQLDISGVELDLLARTLSVKALRLDGLETAHWLKDGGELRISPLLAALGGEGATSAAPASTPPASTEPAEPWALTLAEFQLRNGAVHFTDFSGGLAAQQELTGIGLDLTGISLQDGATMPLKLQARINEGGQLDGDGQLVLKPLALNLRYQLQGLSLLPFNPYVEAHTWLSLQRGTLSLQGDARLDGTSGLPTLRLDLGIADLLAKDSRNGKKILLWQQLDLQQLQLDLAARQLAIQQVRLQKPEINVERNENQQLNLASLAKPVPAQPAATAPAGDGSADQPFAVRVKQLRIDDGITRFRDRSIKPVFKTALHNLEFQLDELSTSASQPARFSLDSRIDKYAPFSAKGTVTPFREPMGLAFTSQLRGLEMPNLSPYSGTYIGYELGSGTLSLDLDYQLKNNRLKGKNGILAKQLYLGDTVASEQATTAPVALGLALLRDLKGDTDLDVDVSGNVDEPGFSVAGLVFKTLMNVLVKAAASPFQLLGSLVGGSQDMNQLAFAPGSAELDAEAAGRLQQLAQALAQRPQLKLDVRGSASAEADRAALQLASVRDAIAAGRKLPAPEIPVDNLLADRKNRNILEDLNDALELPDYGDREDALEKAEPALKDDALEQRIYQQMLQDVAGRQTVDEADLLELADGRALAIKQFLVETAKLDHDRVLMAKARKKDLKGNVCELGLSAG